MDKKKRKILIAFIAIILLVAGGIGIYFYLENKEDSKDDDIKKEYKKVEKKVEDAVKEYIEEDYYYDSNILISDLIERGKIKEKALEVDETDDKCDGYVTIDYSGKNVKAQAYIKCNEYTTKNYDEEVMKTSETISLSYEIVNEDAIDASLSVGYVDLSKYSVIVKGNKNIVKNVGSVKALIDLKELDIKEQGNYNAHDLKLVAYDEDGEEVEDVEIISGDVEANIQIKSYSKTVPVKVVTKGNLVKGKAISSISIDENSRVTIYGAEKDLKDIEYLPVEIDVEGLGNEESKEYKVSLANPTGVTSISETHCEVTIYFDDEGQNEITIDDIQFKNLDSKLSATFKSEEDKKVTVVVTGAKDVVDYMSKYSIDAYVDLKGLKAGEHEVEVQIENKDSRVSYSIAKKVKVVISK